jgi:hypothetical protein
MKPIEYVMIFIECIALPTIVYGFYKYLKDKKRTYYSFNETKSYTIQIFNSIK